jgi:hypothetical protein
MRSTIATLGPVLVLGGCGGAERFTTSDSDGGPDTHADTRLDTTGDPTPDVPPDTGPDGVGDGPPDTPYPDCGDGVAEGSDIPGDGCENGCTWTCERNRECADEDFCTSDVCNVATHVCEHNPIDCTDTDDCTVDGCDPATGCTHERLPDWFRPAAAPGTGCCRASTTA